MKNVSIVVAATEAGGIGKGGRIPWHLRGDMAHFRQLTSTTEKEGNRNSVIMGRKTWDSLPTKYRPLPNRYNIVITRSPDALRYVYFIL